ncbi:MAG: TetR/AcrR family transcriptional regulator [Myxococcota bacterium]
MGRPREVTDEQILKAARKCFLRDGAGATAATIAEELGVSHTTIFNRFGSKEALMIAALGPPEHVPWAARLSAGPDARPMLEQLTEVGRSIAEYFQDVGNAMSVLHAAGIGPEKVLANRDLHGRRTQAFTALAGWLRRAQEQRKLGNCDVDTLAATIISVMRNWTMTARMCGLAATRRANEDFVEGFFEMLWRGVAPPGRHPEKGS